jgi:hypothetical protein
MAMKEREALDMSAVDVASKFLSDVWQHAHKEICDRVDEIDKLARPRVAITVAVPVGWPADARKRLYQASQSSDILGPNLSLARKFVTEAEATGIAIMSTPLDYQGILQVGRANPRTMYTFERRLNHSSEFSIPDRRHSYYLRLWWRNYSE